MSLIRSFPAASRLHWCASQCSPLLTLPLTLRRAYTHKEKSNRNPKQMGGREQSMEREWVNAREREALKRLVAQLNQEFDPQARNAASKLDDILHQHKIDNCKALNEALLSWRNRELGEDVGNVPATRFEIDEGDLVIAQQVVHRLVKLEDEEPPHPRSRMVP